MFFSPRKASPYYYYLLCAAIVITFSPFFVLSTNASILFEDVTESSGVSHISRSFGAAWGDFNTDGLPDLFTNNHQNKPCLFLNKGDGTFDEVYDEFLGGNNIFLDADQHGVAWADFDNDGDQDLVVLVGGNGGGTTSPRNANHLYLNGNTHFTEIADERGVSLSNARGRSPLWFDYDQDGLLDLAASNLISIGTPPSTLFKQNDGFFSDVGGNVGFQFSENTNVFQLADLTRNQQLEIVGFGNSYGILAQEFDTIPFMDVTHQCIVDPTQARGVGSIIADFNNDFLQDIFIPLGATPLELTQVSDNEIHFGMVVSEESKELGFSFTTAGPITLELAAPWYKLTDVFIGSGGSHPIDWHFILDPAVPTNHGMTTYEPNIDRGIYIGYDQVSSSWTIVLNTDFVNPGALDDLHGIIVGNSLITDPIAFGFDPVPKIWKNKLLINTMTSGLTNKSGAWGVGDEIPSISAVAGDFDNDMDLDLYVVNSLPTSNYPNSLYENIGGAFQKVDNAGGASGTNLAIGQNVVTADYDGDGFLDLYVMNGGGAPPFSDYGYHQLFKNTGNQNYWVEIDLEGIMSNRDAVGAVVLITSGGVTQKRIQSGQMHYYSQDHKRLHFGLANNQQIEQLKVIWPSNLTQIITNISSNRIIHVYEPSTDFDRDHDVDGKDLAAFVKILKENSYGASILDFSYNYGK